MTDVKVSYRLDLHGMHYLEHTGKPYVLSFSLLTFSHVVLIEPDRKNGPRFYNICVSNLHLHVHLAFEQVGQ